jgi:hypothetical protein
VFRFFHSRCDLNEPFGCPEELSAEKKTLESLSEPSYSRGRRKNKKKVKKRNGEEEGEGRERIGQAKAPIPGETKVWQYITLTKRIFLIDSPGQCTATMIQRLT